MHTFFNPIHDSLFEHINTHDDLTLYKLVNEYLNDTGFFIKDNAFNLIMNDTIKCQFSLAEAFLIIAWKAKDIKNQAKVLQVRKTKEQKDIEYLYKNLPIIIDYFYTVKNF